MHYSKLKWFIGEEGKCILCDFKKNYSSENRSSAILGLSGR